MIGLDGAAWQLLDPLLDRGTMPRLARLRRRGSWGTLRSTVPTYTPPAWTSASTGVNPGRHGVYGFHAGNAQSERMDLMHSGRIQAPTIWEIVNQQSTRCGVFNMPLTYPPRELDGWMISGMMTPAYGHHLKDFVSPRSLESKVLSWEPDYIVEMKTSWETDWRDEALCGRALESIEQRHNVLRGLLTEEPCEIVLAVLEAPDRLQHAYYRYMDPGDPMHTAGVAARIRPHLDECFRSLDRIVGLLEDYADGGGVVVCSDHGFSAWEASVHVNALLARWGYLKLKPRARIMQTSLARRAVSLAKRALPPKLARAATGRTFAAIDWSRTRAFASPIPMQGVFVNLEGREPFGIVPRSQMDAVKTDLVRRFEALTGPDGRSLTDRVHRSEEVFYGNALDGAPDLMPVLRDHRFELDDEIFHTEPFDDVGHLPRGVHHPAGIVVVAGPGVDAGPGLDGSVMDVTPTLLYLAGLGVPEGLDGDVLSAAFTPEALDEEPVRYVRSPGTHERDESSPYSTEEEAMIEESLQGLGYL
jgi:predicted AlkP superfamily phosphohydrolase/phosphomutase